MRRSAICVVPVLVVGLLIWQTGCQSGAPGAAFLSLFGLSEKPVIVALVPEAGVLDPFTPHEKLRKAMSEALERPVQMRLCLPLTLEANLSLGFYDFAMVTPACYVELKERERFELVAMSVDTRGRAAHAALLVVPTDSQISAVAELQGKKVAFGPYHDSRTHYAGLTLLREHGVAKKDLSLSLLPVPGSLFHIPSADELARKVLAGSFDAGFIDEAAFDALDASARDKLRVIGRTIPLPDKLVIRSPKVGPEVARKVADFLMTADRQHADALHPLLVSAYRKPTQPLRASCERLAQHSEPAPQGRE